MDFRVVDYSVSRRCVNLKGVEVEMSVRSESKLAKRKHSPKLLNSKCLIS